MNPDEKREYNRLYRIANKERIEANRAARKAGLGDNVRRCSVPGCDGVYDTAGYCGRHYMAWRRNGDTELRQEQIHGKTLAERVAAYTRRGRGCWEWIGTRNPAGYGVLNVRESARLAHRIAYTLAYGQIPEGLHVMHRCDNPGCVRPDHLSVGTIADNNADMDAKGRRRSNPPKGSTNPNAKLTEASVRAIRRSSVMGVVLARKYGVSQTIISAVRRGLTWRHVK
jgi:HNH endonuclease